MFSTKFLAASLLALVSAGCRTTAGDGYSSEVANAVGGSSDGGMSCSFSPNGDDFTVRFEQKGETLVLSEQDGGVNTVIAEYSLGPAPRTIVAPVGDPVYRCQDGMNSVVLWDKIVRINGKYYSAMIGCASGSVVSDTSVRFDMSGNTLLITELDGAANAVFAEYTLAPIRLTKEPAEEPRYSCKQGANSFTLWERYARVNGKYYSATIGCAFSPVDDETTVRLDVTGNALLLSEQDGDTNSVLAEYTLAPIRLKMEPVEKPVYSCQQNSNSIALWEKYARVNGKYYSATISCTYFTGGDDGNATKVQLDMSGDALMVSEQSGTAAEVTKAYSVSPIRLKMAPTEAPIYSCQQSSNSIVLWKKYARVNGKYFSLTNR